MKEPKKNDKSHLRDYSTERDAELKAKKAERDAELKAIEDEIEAV